MLQLEVVERMVAAHSTPAYGRLSVALQARFRMKKLFNVGKGAFDQDAYRDALRGALEKKRQTNAVGGVMGPDGQYHDPAPPGYAEGPSNGEMAEGVLDAFGNPLGNASAGLATQAFGSSNNPITNFEEANPISNYPTNAFKKLRHGLGVKF